MTERKIIIIEKAVELFAEKGFSATSVQDITDACGISKGSFYLSFKSKDSLLLDIFQFFSNKLTARMAEMHEKNIDADERIELFYKIYFDEISRYSDFILMQMREQTKPINEDLLDLIKDLRKRSYKHQSDVLIAVYGEKVKKHLPDLHVLLSGILSGYIELIILNKNPFDYTALAKFLVSITDSIIAGLPEPFLKEEQLIGICNNDDHTNINDEQILAELQLIKKEITDEDLLISLDVIEQELLSGNARKPVIVGMLSNLTDVDQTKKLVQWLNIYLKIV